MTTEFELAPGLDAEALASEFRRRKRVRIQPFLSAESGQALRDHLLGREDWRLVINAGDKVFEIDRPGQRSMAPEKRRELDRKVADSAARGFQFRFESIRVPDDAAERIRRGSLLDAFALFLSSPPLVALLSRITGAADVAFSDAQATLYHPGDFLTRHDDDVEGKNRRAAYVFGLTEEWRADWGGLLMFHAADGDVEEAWLPRMNALNLFAVPQPHSVGVVAPFAAAKRYSITGWLRADP